MARDRLNGALVVGVALLLLVGYVGVGSAYAMGANADAVQRDTDAVHRSADAVQESTNAVQESTNAVHRSADAVQRGTDAVQESTNAVHRSADAVQEDQEETANVRAIHVLPVLPNLDVLVEGEPIVLNLSFGDVAGYEPVPTGEVDVEILNNETGEEVFETATTLEGATNYTILAVGSVSDGTVQFQPALLQDELELPAAGNATVRFIHASPDAPRLDVVVRGTGEPVARNVTYRDDGPYVTLPAGNYTLEVRRSTAEGEVVGVRNVTLEGGTASSLIAVGFLDPEAAGLEFPFALAVSDDGRNPAVPATPTPGDGTATPTPGNETPTPGAGNETATP